LSRSSPTLDVGSAAIKLEERSRRMKCPHCKLENPPGAMRCDCGYDFTTTRMPVATKPPSIAAAEKSVTRVGDARVVISDINMRFGSMVVFMVKWAFAAIPALIIIIFAIMFVTISLCSVCLEAPLNYSSTSDSKRYNLDLT
jgi:hypothetical protein